MPADTFFAYAAELLKTIPPHITDEPMIAGLKKIGIEPGTSFALDKADPAIRKALKSAPEEAQLLMSWKLPTLARAGRSKARLSIELTDSRLVGSDNTARLSPRKGQCRWSNNNDPVSQG
jgi:hypothetical protein